MAHPQASLISSHKKLAKQLAAAVALLLLPLLLQAFGTHFVRTADTCLLYVLLALGMNVVVGYAGLLDLGYVAFYAVGAYLFALLASPHLGDNFSAIAALFPAGLHSPWWITIALAAVLAATLCLRLQNSRIGRAWMAIRDDEVAAEAMGINTRNLKLLAFAIGASFGGVAGAMFATFQGFISPEAFTLQESVMIVAMVVFGGLGHVPGVILGAMLLTAFPEMLRYLVGPLQAMTDGRLDAGILRQLLIALAMIVTTLLRPRGLWPAPEHGESLRSVAEDAAASTNRALRADA